ncbi:SDR family NAD(P)-dependent oxidoreductase [Propylenella binzhouense]|uniref:SDR family oxidoreductase n=1 Tax=Propylenella binzhouense TaxID=2555902 RepID=A0A964T8M6_9HYPH|nr:SDR family oxidoreductase [Propylenella binzhouense]MYZ49784.1 SDR family oxidoreductase [Propylenella binzhouense]
MQNARYPSLEGRTVLVTGGATGIGASMVRHFAGQNAKVGFLDMDAGAAEVLHGALPKAVLHFEPCDLREVGSLRSAIANVRTRLGPITVLVNNAARDDRHTVESVTSDYWDERFATNLKHQFFAAQAVCDEMATAGGGSIINMGSGSWLKGHGGMPCYVTAKSAVQGLTRALARDFGPMNIRVNSIIPGWIMTKRQIEKWLTPEGEAEIYSRQCLKRKLQPEDVARLALFLAADDSGAITGQDYVVDGGWM